MKNFIEILRILILFLFKRYEKLFGITFSLFNFIFLIVSARYYFKYKENHIWSFNMYMLSEFIENILFTLVGIYSIK